MNRDSFVKIFVAAASAIALPFAVLAERNKRSRIQKPFKVDAGKDRFDKSITLFEGDTFYTKVSTKDTDGDLYIYESSRMKKGGPALHMHYNQDEWWYVLEGEFVIKVGDQLYEAKPGTAFLVRGVFRMLSPKSAKAMRGC